MRQPGGKPQLANHLYQGQVGLRQPSQHTPSLRGLGLGSSAPFLGYGLSGLISTGCPILMVAPKRL
jgi:hypothetical protein